MHDIKDLDGRGLPGLFVATTAFRETTRSQGTAIGYRSRAVFVPHPVQDRTVDEVHAMARDSVTEILACLRDAGKNSADLRR